MLVNMELPAISMVSTRMEMLRKHSSTLFLPHNQEKEELVSVIP
jgi:hypothetical protein